VVLRVFSTFSHPLLLGVIVIYKKDKKEQT